MGEPNPAGLSDRAENDPVERKRLELALEAAELGTWEVDVAGGVVTASEKTRAMFDFETAQPRVEDWIARLHPDDRNRVRNELQGALSALSKYDTEYRVIADDGSTRWVSAKAVAVFDPASRTTRLVGVAQDITERKRAEEALAVAHGLIQSIIDNTPAIVYAFDLQERFLLANAALAELLNSTPEQMIGKKRHDFMPKEDADWHEANDRHVIESGRALEFEEYSQLKDRSITWLTTKFPLRDEQGKVYAAGGISTDISERKQAEARLGHAQRLESVGVLAGGIAHDFNNILTGILGNASLLQTELSEEPGGRLTIIVESAERAASLTRQLLAYAGKGQFEITDFDVTRLVRSSADLIRISIPKSVDVHVDVPKTLPRIRGDSAQIQQVVMNLVINAAEALEGRDGGRVSIVGAVRDLDSTAVRRIDAALAPGRYISIAVGDNGCGMSDETISRMFDPFFTTKFTGRGLGLAAVHGILRAHKGAITVESQLGLGTTFTVYLPSCEPEGARSAPKRVVEAAKQTATVLVVDDEKEVRAFTKAALERLGHKVLVAENGRQALDLLGRNADIDVVVLDIVMPVLGGMEAFAEMRDRWPAVATLIATGYCRGEAIRLGMPADLPFIEKPYTMRTLGTAVQRALKAHAHDRD